MSPTRREFLAASAALAAGSALRPGAALGSLGRAARPVRRRDFTEIRGNVGIFTERGGTIGWLVNADGVAVVDSQFPEQAQNCIAGLAERSGGRAIDLLINTHHHGDHSGGNIAFRGVTDTVVAHRQAAEHMRNPPGAGAPDDQYFPTATFDDVFTTDVGDERVHARHYGPAHTSGDAVITFERANVAHMGDLMFNLRHPVVDRAAGASLRGWTEVLQAAVDAHDADTIYIFGHAGAGHPVTGGADELLALREYMAAVLAFVEGQVAAGRSPEEIGAMRDPLPGFEVYGDFGEPGARNPLDVAILEVTGA